MIKKNKRYHQKCHADIFIIFQIFEIMCGFIEMKIYN